MRAELFLIIGAIFSASGVHADQTKYPWCYDETTGLVKEDGRFLKEDGAPWTCVDYELLEEEMARERALASKKSSKKK